GEKDKPNASGYRWVIAIQFFWAAILCGGMFFLPESPRYLIKKNRPDQARTSLARVLRADIDSAEVKAEFDEIEANLIHEQSVEKDKPNASGYRWVIAIQFFWAAILCGGMFFLPESPRYLIKKNRPDQARTSLARVLRADIDSAEVKAEFDEIEANLIHEQSV